MLREHSQTCQRQGEPLLLASQLCIHRGVRKTPSRRRNHRSHKPLPHISGEISRPSPYKHAGSQAKLLGQNKPGWHWVTNRLCHPAVSLHTALRGLSVATCGLAGAWQGRVGTPDTHVFQDLLEAGHAEDGDPDGHHGAQEVAVLQGVIVHDAQHGHARLVTRVVELRQKGTKAKVSTEPAAPQGSLGRGGRRGHSPQAGSLLQWLQEAPPNCCGITESR